MQHSVVVSPSSGVDPVRLLNAVLLGTADEGLDFEFKPVRLEGGRSAELWRFRLSTGPTELQGRDLVLRLLPPAAASAAETLIQSGVARVGYPAPEVVHSGLIDDTQRYLIMAYVEGRSLFHMQNPLTAFRRVPPRLADLMVALHRLDPEPIWQSLIEAGASAATDARARALSDVERCLMTVGQPARRKLGYWFEANRPRAVREVVCHGDLHALNVLVNGEIAVIDWELAGLGDPAFDIARTMLLLHAVPMDIPRPGRPLIQRLGRRAATRFESAYQKQSQVSEEAIRWYEALHAARMAGLILAGSPSTPRDAVINAWTPTLPLLVASLKSHTGIDIAAA